MKSNRMNMLDKSGTPIDIRTGNAVRIRRTWRAPQAGRLGVVSAIEPNDAYGAYLIEPRTDSIFDITVRSWNQYWLDPLTFINVRLRDTNPSAQPESSQ